METKLERFERDNPGVITSGDRIYLAAKSSDLAVGTGTKVQKWEEYSGYDRVGSSITVNDTGNVVISEAGIYAVQATIYFASGTVDFARFDYDNSFWGGTHAFTARVENPLIWAGAVTVWLNSGTNSVTVSLSAVASTTITTDTNMHIVRLS